METAKMPRKQGKKVKKNFYYLSVIYKNARSMEDKPDKSIWPAYGYGHITSKKRLIKIAKEKIGKVFTSALLIHRETNTIEYIFTASNGQETWASWNNRKKSKKAQGNTNSLLKLSILLKPSSKEYQKTGKRFTNLYSVDVDYDTGEYGYHVALGSCFEILKGSYWINSFAKAYIWDIKKNKQVFWIDQYFGHEYLCADFQTIINKLSNEST